MIAAYFDEFDEAEELANRFARWTGKMLDDISVDDVGFQDTRDLLDSMVLDLQALLPVVEVVR